jgi:hypothetical protein
LQQCEDISNTGQVAEEAKISSSSSSSKVVMREAMTLML